MRIWCGVPTEPTEAVYTGTPGAQGMNDQDVCRVSRRGHDPQAPASTHERWAQATSGDGS
jgi:hypothetical protein